MPEIPPKEDREEGLPFHAVMVRYVESASELLCTLLREKIDELKALMRSSKSLGWQKYPSIIYKIDQVRGRQALNEFVEYFAQVNDKPIGMQLRALRDAAAVISRKAPTKALLFQEDGSVEPVPVAARRLHDGLLTMRRMPLGLRDALRSIVVEDMEKHAAWPLIKELADFVGKELEVLLTEENKLEDFYDIVDRLLKHLPKDVVSQQHGADLLTKLSAIEGSCISFAKEDEAVAEEEPASDAG